MLAATCLLYVFASTPFELIILRVIEGLGWAILWATLDAGIAENPSMDVNKSFSIYNTIWSAAGSIGPLFGAILVFLLTDIRFTFLVTAGLLLVTAFFNLAGLKKRS